MKTTFRIFFALMAVVLLSCKTEDEKKFPTVRTTAVVFMSDATATCGGNAVYDNGSFISSRGVCWNTSGNPTLADKRLYLGEGLGEFSGDIGGLTPSTNYFVRAFATNSDGTAYGNQVSFTTSAPSVTTSAVSEITVNSATCGGKVLNNTLGIGITERGVCWSTTMFPTIADSKTNEGAGGGELVSKLTGLLYDTQYYVRAYATANGVTSYGQQEEFKTSNGGLTIGVNKQPFVGTNMVDMVGSITQNSQLQILDYGFVYGTTTLPTIENSQKIVSTESPAKFHSLIKGLIAGTGYYVRVYVKTELGRAYSDSYNVYTATADQVIKDVDGNEYHTIKIGTQTWLLENLRTTHYRNGDPIPNLTADNDWLNATNDAWCDYNNIEPTDLRYGHLYNWYAVSDSRNIAPVGWHVATKQEWIDLQIATGDFLYAGAYLKDLKTSDWRTFPSSINLNFMTAFSALPCGYRSVEDGLSKLTRWAFLAWCAEESDISNARTVELDDAFYEVLMKSRSKKEGMSIRCVKDN
ncbi:MAG: fibrobacter succinogenes major paralogous domain-containing protein [Bacteroidales bacterium]